MPQVLFNNYITNGTVDQIQYYNCPTGTVKMAQLQAAVSQAAQLAAGIRNMLDNPDSDQASAAMLDSVFGQASSQGAGAPANLKRVRDAFDNIAQGLAVQPSDPTFRAPMRIACLDFDSAYISINAYADQPTGGL